MKIIQLELNEVSKEIVDRMVADGKLKNFQYINRNYDYVTTTSDSRYENIEPWIQWVSAHTGKSYNEHKIFHLGDAEVLSHSQIWEVLSDNGIESAILGSMNAKQGRMKGGVFFPDPWSKNGKAFPSDLQPLWNLVASKVQTHATSKLQLKDILNGLKCCFKYKIPLKLYIKIARQIISQKINPKKKWRMPALFDELMSCVFMTILEKTKYGFYTLFLNACAHYQHHYWREFDPSKFNKKISSPDIDSGDDPISFGYTIYDKIIGNLIKYVESREDVVLVIATAFTQVPYLDKECEGGMNYYRLIDHGKFLSMFNGDGAHVYPMMSRDWQIDVENVDLIEKLSNKLNKFSVNGEKLFAVNKNGEKSLFVYTSITRQIKNNSEIIYEGKSIGHFYDFFTNIAIKSGHHVSEGSLWLSNQDRSGFSFNGMPITNLFNYNLSLLLNKSSGAGSSVRCADEMIV